MASDGLFLRSGAQLRVMHKAPYDTEAVLQEALALFPEVLAGPTTEGESGGLLLVRREMPISSTEPGSGAFALDHLFLDGDGVPVLVEVKRSTDTRIRREVVGQMLDYAANATTNWPLSVLQEGLARTADAAETTVDELVQTIRPAGDVDEFWRAVEANLRAGRIRLLFVADELPDGLVRVIEFLNGQMAPAEVLGVELRQYVGDGQVVYVPRVVGRTAAAVATKSTAAGGQLWDRDSFLAAANERCSPAEVGLVERLLEHVDMRGHHLVWGKGATPGASGWYALDGRPTAVWVLNLNDVRPSTRAYLTFYLADVVRHTPDRVLDAAEVLERIPALTQRIAVARENQWHKYPSVYLPEIAENGPDLERLFTALALLTGAPTSAAPASRT